MTHNKSFLKKLFFVSLIILISNNFSFSTYAKLKTKAESNRFLDNYCLEIINAIKDAYEIQKISIEKKDLEEFSKQGRWIAGLSSVYGNLCRE